MKKIKQLKQTGFTLLELLVVISIIGILMALGVVAYSTAQKRGRDAQRRGDLKAISSALEQYYAATGGYPVSNSCSGIATAMGTDYLPGGAPTDPKQNYSYTCNSSSSSYYLCADVESDDGNNDAADDSPGGGTDYFCLYDLQ